jgi:filamentous hemagglutinin family protein
MNRLIDFSSRFRILKGGKISLVVSALLGSAVIASAAPSGGVVTSGNANISQSGNVTNINQSSGKASINWNDFSVKANETVNFNQPNSSSITLNRVIGNERSIIDGALNANGQVWILNSNGILFGKNASVNTAGLLATTAELSDTDFQAGNYNFKNSSSNSVINLGTIKVENSSYVVLAGKEVENGGNIEAILGKVHLVGANEYSINLNGNSIVSLRVNKGVLDAMVKNSGNILANGGEIFLTTNAVDELLKGVVNNEGIIEANSLDGITGKVELFAHGGEVQVGGTITAKDGLVETSGKNFKIKENTTVKAKEWLIDPVDITIDQALAGAIETQLSQGNAIVEADNDITINSNLINSGTGNTLILTADVDNSGDGDINVNAVVTVGAGDGITLNYGANGNLITQRDDTTDTFTGKINLDSTSVITINGNVYTVVNTVSDLQNITDGSNYVLGGDIDLTNTSWTPFSFFWNNAASSIDGLGHTVSNLIINTSNSNQGLFARLENASIQNLGLVDSTITGGENTGSLIGFANTVTLNNVFSNATVTGPNSIGGLIGQTVDTNIYNSYHNANVTGTYMDIGGLVGYINGTTLIENSFAKGILSTGNFSGNSNLGGLVGGVYDSLTINNSYAESTITGTGNNVGGLVGYDNNVVHINNSYARGTITGVENVGGLVGFLSWDGSTISNSYFSGSVTGTTYVGGLTGGSNGDISNSYAIGSVIGDASVGGLIGYMDYGTLTNSYASNTVSSTSMTPSMLGGVVGEFWQGGSPAYTQINSNSKLIL